MTITNQNISAKYIKNAFLAGRDLILFIINISERKPGEKPRFWGILKIAVFNYIVALLLDWLLFYPRREIRLGSKGLYIDRPCGVGDLLLWYLILAITLLGFYFLFSWIYKKVKIESKSIGTGTISSGFMVILGPIVFFLSYIVPIAQVDNINAISGRVPDLGHSYSYLFVRPFGLTQCWLQDPVPIQEDSDGKWRTLAYFGGITGMGYELVLINSKTKIDKFTLAGGYDCNDIPREVKKFVRVVYHK